ncbi:hypothetical protein F4819DRAFT_7597 [Hypoxylon fuscum]|nr:hypothetical protein F4819DRAFT_7597 [Hypoxylon fuscum]
MDSQISPAQGQKGLLHIPLEVLLKIASYLTTPEYGMLRRTCRAVDGSLLNAFAREYFNKKSFVLTEFSLEALVGISKSRLAPHMRYLIISLEYPRREPSLNIPATPATTTDTMLKFNKWKEEYFNHKTLLDSGGDFELLSEALRNFPNLETVGLRDFDTPGRRRDGETLFWRAYGAPTFYSDTGYRLSRATVRRSYDPENECRESENYISHTFLTILRALGNVKAIHRPTRLEVILRSGSVPESACNIPRRLEPVILPVLENLKALYLDLGENSFTVSEINEGGHLRRYHGLLVLKLLSKTQSLEHLRLNFGQGYHPVPILTQAAEDLLDWLAGSLTPTSAPAQPMPIDDEGLDRFPQLPQAPALPRLEQLDIGDVTIKPDSLLKLYKRYDSSLCRISLHKISLLGNVKLWPQFLDQTTKLGINFTSIQLSHIGQRRDASHYRVKFKDPGDDPNAAGRPVKRWEGSDCKCISKPRPKGLSVY